MGSSASEAIAARRPCDRLSVERYGGAKNVDHHVLPVTDVSSLSLLSWFFFDKHNGILRDFSPAAGQICKFFFSVFFLEL